MGGQAYLIWGRIDEQRLKPVPAKRSFLDKMLGREKFLGRRETDLPDGTKLIDLPAGDLELLAEEFSGFLEQRISLPWPATEIFQNYLADDVISIYVRGEHTPDKPSPDWYVQMTFSGCAGLAEISAALGTHWAEIWFRDEAERITERYLEPFGFIPAENQIVPDYRSAFLPVGRFGYALFSGETEIDPEWPGSRCFELDAAATEAFELDGSVARLRVLDEKYAPIMCDGNCRCQLCMPDFDPSEIDDEFS